MNTDDQIAAEAASRIDEFYTNEEDNCVKKTISIIKSAIEKALEPCERGLCKGAALMSVAAEKSRAAHASDGGVCSECGTAWPRHKGLCSGEHQPAHASEQEKGTRLKQMDDCPHVDEATGERHHKYDKDGFCIFCGNKKPANASEP